jgi:hypothetical protein
MVMTPSIVVALCLTQAPAAPEVVLPPATVALVEAYADGRVSYELTSAKPAWMWTIKFPRIRDWQPAPGTPPLRAVKLARVLVGRDVRVDVSVLRGAALEDEVPVTSVVVTHGAHVIVKELRAFGVEPIDLSLDEAAPMTPYLPTVFSVSPNLEIASVAPRDAPYPGYRIPVRNLSSKAAANFHVQTYRGADKALSSLQRGAEGRPAMIPGGTFTFDVNLTSGRKTETGLLEPTPLDVIEIDSVRWDDGTVDGVPVMPSAVIASDAGRRTQLTRVTTILRNAIHDGRDADLLARIKSEIAALPDYDEAQLADARTAMRAAKAAALDDVRRFERDRSIGHAPDVMSWLTATLDRYDRWITRLAP